MSFYNNEYGWLFEFVWKDAEKNTVMEIAPSVLYGLSLVMIVFFSGTGPVFMRAMGGIWEIYNTVTSIFGDLLSYIRLFALGIASSILGLVINQMAISFGSAPYIGPVIFVLIIVIGHTPILPFHRWEPLYTLCDSRLWSSTKMPDFREPENPISHFRNE